MSVSLNYKMNRGLDVPGTKPEEHDGMELVGIGNQQHREHEEEQEMPEDEVGGKHAEFANLAEELTTRLCDRVPAHRVPFTRPPSNVGCVSLEFTGQDQGDDQFEEESLNGGHSDHSRQGLGKAEVLQEHHDHKEKEQHDHGHGVGNGGQNSTELLAAHA